MCVWPVVREGGGDCVTLGAMFAASRDARPGGDRACRGAARSPQAGPAAGRAGLREPRAERGRGSSAGGGGGSPSPALRLAPARLRAGAVRRGGRFSLRRG